MTSTFRALVAREQTKVAFEELTDVDLPHYDVSIDVTHSSLNYKDGLAVTGRGRIVRRFPMILGIDLAGTVRESSTTEFRSGQRVLGTGQGLGESEWGGYASRASVKSNALLPIPDSLSAQDAMALGTAGLTAMLCVLALERNGLTPADGEIVVTGAGGGVGSIAVHLLSRHGYRVAASTGRPELEGYLRALGAASIIDRAEFSGNGSPLQSERWAGAIDTIGGQPLANLFAQVAYGGSVACCGMAGGHELPVTVWPLILRSVSLLGVSSLKTPKQERVDAWSRLAADVDRNALEQISRVESLSAIHDLAGEIVSGGVRGRVVIDVNR